jgi:hypothetical protein
VQQRSTVKRQQAPASRGGMFATGQHSTLKSRGSMQGDYEDAFGDQQDMGVPGSAFAAPRHQQAAAAAVGGNRRYGSSRRQGQQGGAPRGHSEAGGMFGASGRGFGVAAMESAPRECSGPAGSATSSLFAPAFMPHRNPSKQLKYKLPGAVGQGGVVKRKKGGRGGGQTKLCWG